MATRPLKSKNDRSKYNRIAIDQFLGNGLWITEDHLMCSASVYFRETYKQFFFRDIQALYLYRTKRYEITSVILTVTALLMAAGLFIPALAARIFFGVLACSALIHLIFHMVRGPTCKCYVQTEVQTMRLSALKRVKQAERAFQLLDRFIRVAQDDLPVPTDRSESEDISGDDTASSADVSRPAVSQTTPAVPPPVEKSTQVKRQEDAAGVPIAYGGLWHRVFFGLLVVHGIFAALLLATQDFVWGFPAVGALGIGWCFGIPAVVLQRKSALQVRCRWLTWLTFAYSTAITLVGFYGGFILISFAMQSGLGIRFAMIGRAWPENGIAAMILAALIAMLAGLSLILGVIGLTTVRLDRWIQPTPQRPPPVPGETAAAAEPGAE